MAFTGHYVIRSVVTTAGVCPNLHESIKIIGVKIATICVITHDVATEFFNSQWAYMSMAYFAQKTTVFSWKVGGIFGKLYFFNLKKKAIKTSDQQELK